MKLIIQFNTIINKASSLSVWDRTSDYSSHGAGSTSGNDKPASGQLPVLSKGKTTAKTLQIPHFSKSQIHSKPCFV